MHERKENDNTIGKKMINRIEELIYRNKKVFFIIILIVGFIHQLIGYSKNIDFKELIVFYFISIVISFISYGMIILQYNFQKKCNPLMKISTLNKFNNFEIICSTIFLIIAIVYDLIISNFQTEDSFIPIFSSPIALSFCLACIKNKRGNENNKINNDILYEKVKNPKKVIAIFIIIFGAGWFIVGNGLFIKNELFKHNSIETTGTVIGYKEYNNSEKRITYSTKYSYFDEKNIEHIKIGSSASYPPEYPIGTKIKVFYSKSDSDKAIYESKTVIILCSVFGIGGFIILIIGIIIYLYSKMGKNI